MRMPIRPSSLTKRELSRRVQSGPFRAVARVAVDAAIAAELLAVRAVGWRRRVPTVIDGGELTVIVKTFERPRELRRLVRSVRRLQPGVAIVVADDSRRPREVDGAEVVRLPFNSGVSAGRNAALERVETEFFVTLDDDFVLTKHTDFDGPLNVLRSTPEIDIVGGVIVNLPDFSTTDYSRAGLFRTDQQPLRPPGSTVGGLPVRLKVPNFFVGRTASVRRVGWTDELLFVEHLDFFTRACGELLVVQDERMIALHAKNPFDRHGAERQANVDASWRVLDARYGGG